MRSGCLEQTPVGADHACDVRWVAHNCSALRHGLVRRRILPAAAAEVLSCSKYLPELRCQFGVFPALHTDRCLWNWDMLTVPDAPSRCATGMLRAVRLQPDRKRQRPVSGVWRGVLETCRCPSRRRGERPDAYNERVDLSCPTGKPTPVIFRKPGAMNLKLLPDVHCNNDSATPSFAPTNQFSTMRHFAHSIP